MKKIFGLLLLFCFFSALPVFATPEIGLPMMSTPTIDGKISPGEWDSATRVTGFHVLGGAEIEPNRSVIYVGWNAEYFFFAYRFYGPSKPKGVDRGRSGPYWEDDSVEFFINANKEKSVYYQVLANCRGGWTCYGYNTAGEEENQVGGKYVDIQADYKTYLSPSYDELIPAQENLWWEGEMKIKWENLNYSPKAGDVGFLFITRDNISPEPYKSDYGFAVSTFHEKDKYSTLHFLNNTATARLKDNLQDFEIVNLNQKYHCYGRKRN